MLKSIKAKMARSKAVNLRPGARKHSSHMWLTRQLNDPYVIQAKIDGYRSRAAYKILEIHEKFDLFKGGMKVVDLGAAPGGWSQVAAQYVGNNGKVVAIDLLEIKDIAGVHAIQMDFYKPEAASLIKDMLSDNADIVMSDMAANTTGHAKTDYLRIMDVCEHNFIFATSILKNGGHFIAKILRGGAEKDLLTYIKQNFSKVFHFKPKSSRQDSKEIYLIAIGFRGRALADMRCLYE